MPVVVVAVKLVFEMQLLRVNMMELLLVVVTLRLEMLRQRQTLLL